MTGIGNGNNSSLIEDLADPTFASPIFSHISIEYSWMWWSRRLFMYVCAPRARLQSSLEETANTSMLRDMLHDT